MISNLCIQKGRRHHRAQQDAETRQNRGGRSRRGHRVQGNGEEVMQRSKRTGQRGEISQVPPRSPDAGEPARYVREGEEERGGREARRVEEPTTEVGERDARTDKGTGRDNAGSEPKVEEPATKGHW